MTNQLSALLAQWQSNQEETDWVLGTVYRTSGSSYRKAGAMMIINGLGQYFGMLSGGCLEADILRHARRVMQSGKLCRIRYDGADEDDWSYQLGIGCGGCVDIVLHPLHGQNPLGLADLSASLVRREGGQLHLNLTAVGGYFEPGEPDGSLARMEQRGGEEWLRIPVRPEPCLMIVGGGADAKPLAAIAGELGWQVAITDPRSTHARRDQFPSVGEIVRNIDDGLSTFLAQRRVDGVVIMTHNLSLDAAALRCCQNSGLSYLALLGPAKRYQQVLEMAGIDAGSLPCPVSAPAGYDIGGRLPESIALSILSECHAVLHLGERLPALRLAAG